MRAAFAIVYYTRLYLRKFAFAATVSQNAKISNTFFFTLFSIINNYF